MISMNSFRLRLQEIGMSTRTIEQISLLGGGSWGTAIIKMLSHHLQKPDPSFKHLNWWVRSEEKADYIRKNRHNPDYLSSVEIHPDTVNTTSNLIEAVESSQLIVLAIPSAFINQSLESLRGIDLKNKLIVSAVKGLIPHTRQIVTDYLQESFGVPAENLLVISGPCHAEEVSAEKLSYLTIASESQNHARLFAALLESRYIRTVVSNDPRGTEFGAVLKNIYAVAAGICHGLGFGDNFQAVLMSNSIREMERFLRHITDTHRKINHSAYLGDLLVTGYSQFSRNRTFGNMIGKGHSVQSAQLEMKMVAEGYYATKSIYELNRERQVIMPILEAVYQILYNNQSARKEIDKLCEKMV